MYKRQVLSDILGDEDHLEDMDFKVTGTKDSITATQIDIKVDGPVSYTHLQTTWKPVEITKFGLSNGLPCACLFLRQRNQAATPVSYTHLT